MNLKSLRYLLSQMYECFSRLVTFLPSILFRRLGPTSEHHICNGKPNSITLYQTLHVQTDYVTELSTKISLTVLWPDWQDRRGGSGTLWFVFCLDTSLFVKNIQFLIKWLGKANHISETMSTENCLIIRIPWFPELTCTQTFWNCEKTVKDFKWGLLHDITRSIAEMMYEPSFTKLHSQRKEMQLPTVLRDEFLLFYMYSNLWVLRENLEQFWNRVFLHIVTKSIAQNEICYKVHLTTLFPKRYRTVHGVFLLRLSVNAEHLECFENFYIKSLYLLPY